jgi:hypothetical protein
LGRGRDRTEDFLPVRARVAGRLAIDADATNLTKMATGARHRAARIKRESRPPTDAARSAEDGVWNPPRRARSFVPWNSP